MNSLAAFILVLLAMPIKNILHLEGMGAKIGGGGRSRSSLLLAWRCVMDRVWGSFSLIRESVCVLFKRHCAILHCVEKQLQREKRRVEVGRADVCVGNEAN